MPRVIHVVISNISGDPGLDWINWSGDVHWCNYWSGYRETFSDREVIVQLSRHGATTGGWFVYERYFGTGHQIAVTKRPNGVCSPAGTYTCYYDWYFILGFGFWREDIIQATVSY